MQKKECLARWNLPFIKIVILDSLTNTIEPIGLESFELTPTNYGGYTLIVSPADLPQVYYELKTDTLLVRTHPHILAFKIEYNEIEIGEIEVDLIETEEANCEITYEIDALRSNNGEICESENQYLIKLIN